MFSILTMKDSDFIERVNDLGDQVDTHEIWVSNPLIPPLTSIPFIVTTQYDNLENKAYDIKELIALSQNGSWTSIIVGSKKMLELNLQNENVRECKDSMIIWYLRLQALIHNGCIFEANKEYTNLGDFDSSSFFIDKACTISFDMRLLAAKDLQSSPSMSLTRLYTLLVKCNSVLACNLIFRSEEATSLWKNRRITICKYIAEQLCVNNQLGRAVDFACKLECDPVWIRLYLTMLSLGMHRNVDIPSHILKKCQPFLLAFYGQYSQALDKFQEENNMAVCSAYAGNIKHCANTLNKLLNANHSSKCLHPNFDILCNKLLKGVITNNDSV